MTYGSCMTGRVSKTPLWADSVKMFRFAWDELVVSALTTLMKLFIESWVNFVQA